MSQEMTGIINGLKEEKEKLGGIVNGLQKELEEAEVNYNRVSDAVMVLESGGGKRKGKKRGGGKSKTPAATRADVIAIVEKEVKEKGVVAVELLKEAVESAVVESGKNKLGLALRFKEAVVDERFEKTAEGLKLAGKK